jgi:hypothetical protein
MNSDQNPATKFQILILLYLGHLLEGVFVFSRVIDSTTRNRRRLRFFCRDLPRWLDQIPPHGEFLLTVSFPELSNHLRSRGGPEISLFTRHLRIHNFACVQSPLYVRGRWTSSINAHESYCSNLRRVTEKGSASLHRQWRNRKRTWEASATWWRDTHALLDEITKSIQNRASLN